VSVLSVLLPVRDFLGNTYGSNRTNVRSILGSLFRLSPATLEQNEVIFVVHSFNLQGTAHLVRPLRPSCVR
jgi:hypothetical protein